MPHELPAPLPPLGHVARLSLNAKLEVLRSADPSQIGVFLAADGSLIVSNGEVALSVLPETAADAGRMAFALLGVAAALEEREGKAASAADAALSRLLASREAAGNA